MNEPVFLPVNETWQVCAKCCKISEPGGTVGLGGALMVCNPALQCVLQRSLHGPRAGCCSVACVKWAVALIPAAAAESLSNARDHPALPGIAVGTRGSRGWAARKINPMPFERCFICTVQCRAPLAQLLLDLKPSPMVSAGLNCTLCRGSSLCPANSVCWFVFPLSWLQGCQALVFYHLFVCPIWVHFQPLLAWPGAQQHPAPRCLHSALWLVPSQTGRARVLPSFAFWKWVEINYRAARCNYPTKPGKPLLCEAGGMDLSMQTWGLCLSEAPTDRPQCFGSDRHWVWSM